MHTHERLYKNLGKVESIWQVRGDVIQSKK
jgi:hypothetical protein